MKQPSDISFGNKFSRYFPGLGSMAKCVVCEKPTSGSLEFCKKCYHSNKDDVQDKKPWVRALKNDAQRERRRREREFEDVSLDAIIDGHYNREPY